MQVAPSGGHASSATWWPKLEPMKMQVAFFLAGELNSQYPGSVVPLAMFLKCVTKMLLTGPDKFITHKYNFEWNSIGLLK